MPLLLCRAGLRVKVVEHVHHAPKRLVIGLHGRDLTKRIPYMHCTVDTTPLDRTVRLLGLLEFREHDHLVGDGDAQLVRQHLHLLEKSLPKVVGGGWAWDGEVLRLNERPIGL